MPNFWPIVMSDNGNALPGVRLLIERDAFSGEGAEDLDEILTGSIGFTDVDENGEWSFLAPAEIRVSALLKRPNDLSNGLW